MSPMLPPLFAFLHHVCAFSIFAALVSEHLYLSDPLSPESARKLIVLDRIYGIAAGLILIFGFSRVFLFEKGKDFYFNDVFFHLKLAIFSLVGIASIYPTLTFLQWRKALAAGQTPELAPERKKLVMLCLRVELFGIFAMWACAALMAKGIGVFR